MIRLSLAQLREGMELARPLLNPADPSHVLLKRGFVLKPSIIKSLQRFGIRECWIRNERLGFLEDLITSDLHESQRQALVTIRKSFEGMLTGSVQELPIDLFENAVHGLIVAIKNAKATFSLMENLSSIDNRLFSHSANVCYLSILMGIRLEEYVISQRKDLGMAHAKELDNLGLGALIHDIGRLFLPESIQVKSTGMYTAAEVEELRLHPEKGYQIARGRVEPSARNVVLNHHQRWDGNGYPARKDPQSGNAMPPLSGDKIPVFSRVVAIANHYDAGTMEYVRPLTHKTSVQTLYEMRYVTCRGWFDPEIEKVFYRLVPPFPIGSKVTLSSRHEAAVVDFNPDTPCQPTVAILTDRQGHPLPPGKDVEINLKDTPDVYIKDFEGQNVSRYLF